MSYDGPNRRINGDLRSAIDRAAEAGACKAMEKFAEMTPFDLSAKKGREQFRSVLYHADSLRRLCDKTKNIAGDTAIKFAFRFGVLAAIIGVLVLLGFSPEDIRHLEASP